MTSFLLITLALVTFINRFFFLYERIKLLPSDNVRRFLSYSSYAVLTAIWAPLVLKYSPSEGLAVSGWDYLISAALAAVLALMKVRSILVVLLSTGCFFALRFFVF